ncbi:nucleotide exchange factor GrpE [Celeribacter persicus]|jgi:Molecular chaperone GrpE (heat shock protein)|uniref:Protein GrpE n=1 Tax=Celeribacter persicus TaxID=1651082 RepID=A0A2T5HDQ8_9RHOB|nr:nucleotide exchange factor GrpE [Celeribacter persicus]PTQ69702.1 molecular chaperone GrpE [Celeribacter persicus]
MTDPKKDMSEEIETEIDEIIDITSEEALEGPDEDDVMAELEQLRAERDEFRDRFMRAVADAENSRKRADRDRREAENYGGSKLARDMLPVFDNMKRAVDTITEEQREQQAALIEGIELTMRELLNVFGKHGIQIIAPEVGDKFDPNQHEAMFEAPVPNTKAGDIIQVMNVGFMIHDRLLRPAQVGVSSTPA